MKKKKRKWYVTNAKIAIKQYIFSQILNMILNVKHAKLKCSLCMKKIIILRMA